MIWIVSGASKGVGKTALSLELKRVLPYSIYVKHGHGIPSPNKEKNFFRSYKSLKTFIIKKQREFKNIIIESNEMALKKEGDVIIFIDTKDKTKKIRQDAGILKKTAHIILDPISGNYKCTKALEKLINDKKIIKKVESAIEIFVKSFKSKILIPRFKLWFEYKGKTAFGPGLCQILESIKSEKSISSAAKENNISYRHAWDIIKHAEENLGIKLVIGKKGGKKGGETILTKEGKDLLITYNKILSDLGYICLRNHMEIKNDNTGISI